MATCLWYTIEYVSFISKANYFDFFYSIRDRWVLDTKSWLVMHGSSAPLLQNLVLTFLCNLALHLTLLKEISWVLKWAEDLFYVIQIWGFWIGKLKITKGELKCETLMEMHWKVLKMFKFLKLNRCHLMNQIWKPLYLYLLMMVKWWKRRWHWYYYNILQYLNLDLVLGNVLKLVFKIWFLLDNDLTNV